MKNLIFILALLGTPAWATTYYMRADGSAASKAAATGCGSASTAMSVTTHNSQTFSAGDNIVMCDAGGVYRTTMVPPSSGSSGSPITYSASGSPIISADSLTTWTQGAGIPAQDCANGTSTFCSGMETGGSTFTDWGSRTQTSANITQSTAQVDHGTYSAALTGTGGNNQAFLTTPAFTAWANNSTHYARVYIYIPSGSLNAGGTQLKWLTPSTGGFVTLDWNGSAVSSVSLVGDAGNTFVGTLTTALFTLNTWHYVDVMWVVSSTVGGMQVWIDGTSIGSVLNTDTHLDTGATTWRVGMTGTASTLLNNGSSVYFDDARFSDTGPIGAFNTGGAYPTTVWRASQATNPYLLNFNAAGSCTSMPSSCLGIPVGSLGAVTAANDWYWDGSTYVYVYGSSAPTSTVEIPTLTNAMTITGLQYLTFTGITFRGGLSHSVYLTGQTSHDYFNSDVFELSYYDGWYLLENSATLIDEQLTNSIFRYNGASGMQVNASYWTNFIVSGNQAYYNAQVPSSETNHNFAAGLHTYCNVTAGGSGSVFSNNLVYDNGVGAVPTPTLAGQGNGIWSDTCTGITITHNYLQDNFQNDIFLEKNYNSVASYNVVYSTITHFNYTGGIAVQSISGNSAVNNTVVGNSLYGTFWWGLDQNAQDTSTTTATGNVWHNNIVIMTGANQYALYVDSYTYNSGANGNVWDHNAFGPAVSCFAFFGGSCQATYAALDTAYGSAMHNVQTDPKYTTPGSGILTLQATSPAIGAGTPVAGYNVGLLPASVWPSSVLLGSQGSAWNMGAYVTPGGINPFWFSIP